MPSKSNLSKSLFKLFEHKPHDTITVLASEEPAPREMEHLTTSRLVIQMEVEVATVGVTSKIPIISVGRMDAQGTQTIRPSHAIIPLEDTTLLLPSRIIAVVVLDGSKIKNEMMG